MLNNGAISGAVFFRQDEAVWVEVPEGFRGFDELDDFLALAGLELMDPEECESELLENGKIRIWCAWIDGVVR